MASVRTHHSASRSSIRAYGSAVAIVGTVFTTVFAVCGCSSLSSGLTDQSSASASSQPAAAEASISERANAASKAARVSNPLAKQIRFDGQEQLLGGGSCEAISTDDLLKQLRTLFEEQKLRSLVALVQLNGRSTRRLLIERPNDLDDRLTELVSITLDEGTSESPWTTFAATWRTQPEMKSKWQAAVATLATANVTQDAETETGGLTEIATQLDHPLLKVESLRARAQLEVAGGNTQKAIETLVSAAELAAQSRLPVIASDLWLMSCDASLRMDHVSQARQCWTAAVASQLASMHARGQRQPLPTVDPVFWEHAVRLAHPEDELPKELGLTLAPWCARVGVRATEQLTPEAALWTAIAEYQLATGQPHVASVSVKRAEMDAAPEARPYLQILLARAMAAQGQLEVATTVLGSLFESGDPNVRAASLATMGSIKMQSGAYEQGGEFLGRALSIPQASQWPGQLAAQADLANLRLIVGRLDEALPVLHAVQTEMLKADKWQSLCHSLANEAAILELEGRKQDAKQRHERIAMIERQI